MNSDLEAIKGNLFPSSHSAIHDWEKFPWHRDREGRIQTHKIRSSQALAIDVFGTIMNSDERDRILGSLARHCRLPDDGPWTVELEWTDQDSLLREPRPTQVDAIAVGGRALLIIECKFTEPGGGCSQPHRLRTGPHRGMRQCTGHYEWQTNPVNGVAARCALTGKGVRYWEFIPNIFGFDADRDHSPCPFKGEAYQWMRNLALAKALGSARGLSSAVLAAYADAECFVTAKKVRSSHLGHVAASGAPLVVPLSYQFILALARSLSGRPAEWEALATWVERKIEAAASQIIAAPGHAVC